MDDTEPSPAKAAAPDLKMLMASVIRLMALCSQDGCDARQRTLLHLLDYLLKHPALEADEGPAAAVRQAAAIWRHVIEGKQPAPGDPGDSATWH